ncbi:MAG: hypothetical protein HQK69_06150 [Desulfamplus sp.]|nr:hypothetical protein [Desulfamplus sp.]
MKILHYLPSMLQLRKFAKIKPKFMSYLFFVLFFFIIGCVQFTNSPPVSGEFISGKKLSEIYAKQDAIDSRCINYPISVNSNIINNIENHVSKFKNENKSTDFINGFSKNYHNEYIEYMSLYCDNLDSSDEYIKP